jgi:diguanylate cyclase (GGDEF)-like protein
MFKIVAGASKKLRRQAQENEHQALHDPLTGLPNRTLFRDRTQQAILSAQRDGTSVAVLIMDLDRFKEVNDTLGHHSGDELLKELADRLNDAVRESDSVARLGGDEFGVLLPRVSAAAGAVDVAERIRAALSEPFALHGLPLAVEASVGAALYPEHAADVDTLIQHADVAMYLAKSANSDFELYDEANDEYDPARLTLVGELRRALAEHEIILYFQPKLGLSTGRVSGVEVLVRWRHPERGLLYPDEFIPLAQHTGLIKPFTLYVVDKALAHCAAWRQDGLELRVAVNLAMRNLLDLGFPADVAALLRKWDVNAELLELEITESTIMADPFRARQVLMQLHEMGVRLAIDDFGTGYSSLSYLRRLPVQEIKIDKSFVMNMADDENDAVIVRSTIDLARNLGLEVVAEGVENARTWNDLEAFGCDVAQGYFLSRPVVAEELARWLQENRALVSSEPEEAESRRLA